MPARITIQSGIAAGTLHRIESRVARIGSDPKSDICLPTAEIPGHALTLEFRDDRCLVYNRCRDNVYIGAQLVEPDHSGEWPETDILQLGQDIELLLDLEDPDDPIHGDAEEYEADIEETSAQISNSEASELQQVKTSTSLTKTVLQVVVIFLCIAGCALLLIRDQNRKSGPDSGPGFSEIISTAIASPDISTELIQRLQYAESQRIRGRSKTAEEEFQSIRDDLIAELNQPETSSTNFNSQILQFIQTRLATDS